MLRGLNELSANNQEKHRLTLFKDSVIPDFYQSNNLSRPFSSLPSSFHSPFPISEQWSKELDERIMRDYYFGISRELRGYIRDSTSTTINNTINESVNHIQIGLRLCIFRIYTYHLIQMVYRLRCLPHGIIHHSQFQQHKFPFSFILFLTFAGAW